MSSLDFYWVEVGQIVVSLAFFGWLFWAFARRKHRKTEGVPDSREDEPYRVYTTAHDLTLRAQDVPRMLSADTYLLAQGWVLRDPKIWQRKADNARSLQRSLPASLDTAIASVFDQVAAEDWAICLLIDHSGSMRGDPITHTAATVRRVSDGLVAAGAKVAILGFSTVGWHGGRACQDWLWNGQPKRPGRLCALLHIDYQMFGEKLTELDWEVMLHPDILRENIDGEALEWAASLISDRPEPHRLLIVLSDGAPVDDSTLTHNGPSLLERHLLSVIARVDAESKLTLAAVGIGFAVDRYYCRSCSTKVLSELPQTLVGMIGEVVRSKCQEKHDV